METKKTNSYTKQPKEVKSKDFTAEQKQKIIARANPKIDNNVVKGYN